MKLLLDTHIWLWSVSDTGRLHRRVIRSLTDPRNELWVSPISTWEIVLLHESGRLKLAGGPEVWLKKALAQAPVREAPLTHEIALVTRSVQLPHRDPADRFLVATALVHGFTLVTADGNVSLSQQVPILPNR